MKRFLAFLLGALSFTSTEVEAILDGRTTPTFIHSTYTFTNYEWARGAVYFTAGFEVPPSVTAVLGLTVPVQGDVQCCYHGNPSTPSGIILETPLIMNGNLVGGVTFKTSDGSQGTIAGLKGIGDAIIFGDDFLIDLQGGTLRSDGDTNGPFDLPSRFIISNPAPKTLSLTNGTVIFADNAFHVTPMFCGGPTAGRHELALEGVSLVMGSRNFVPSISPEGDISQPVNPLMTFTNLDFTCRNGVSWIIGQPGATAEFYSALNIRDDAALALAPGVELHLTPSIVESSYFQLAGRGKLYLNSNLVSFNRPLRIPSTFPAQDTTPTLIVDGATVLRGTGAGSNNTIEFGAGPKLTYTYDALLDIATGALLQLDNVTFINKNFVL